MNSEGMNSEGNSGMNSEGNSEAKVIKTDPCDIFKIMREGALKE